MHSLHRNITIKWFILIVFNKCHCSFPDQICCISIHIRTVVLINPPIILMVRIHIAIEIIPAPIVVAGPFIKPISIHSFTPFLAVFLFENVIRRINVTHSGDRCSIPINREIRESIMPFSKSSCHITIGLKVLCHVRNVVV